MLEYLIGRGRHRGVGRELKGMYGVGMWFARMGHEQECLPQ